MKIKVCGLRDTENVLELYEAGIRMMGFIFYDKSKRFVDVERRRNLYDSIPSDVKKVGVFVNESVDFVIRIVEDCGLDFVQLHGEEAPEFCLEVQKFAKVIKAFRVDESFDFSELEDYQICDYLLFDAKGKEYGGNGIKYDWDLLQAYKLETPFLLSGGIGPDDVDEILSFEHSKFIGIDINSGFEIEPGLKDVEKIKSFISYLKCSTQ
jgi:phosphoribosylanthranilate isomerase